MTRVDSMVLCCLIGNFILSIYIYIFSALYRVYVRMVLEMHYMEFDSLEFKLHLECI